MRATMASLGLITLTVPALISSYAQAEGDPASAATRSPAPGAAAETSTTPPEQSIFGVEEIIVTGTAVSERTKFDSSVAISTFTAQDIAKQAPASSADLISSVPGFWVESTSGTTQGNVFARGIIQDGGYRYVGLMEDGIPLYPVFELSFYNPDQFVRVDETVDRVEAVRGGTSPIFTAGAVGGTVNFVSRTPGNAPSGVFKLSLSDYNMYRGDVSWTAPFGDWGLAIGGYYRKSDGIRDPGYPADEGGQLRLALSRTFDGGDFEVFGKYIDDRSLFVVPIPLTGNPSSPHGLNGADAGTYSLHSEDLARAGLPVSADEVGLQGSDLRNGIHPTLGTLGAKVDYEFNDTVSLKNLFRYTKGEVRFDGIFSGAVPESGVDFAATAVPGGVAPNYTVIESGQPYAATDLVQNQGHWVVNKDYYAVQNDLRFNFALGAHALAVGAYYADYTMGDRWSLGNLLLMDVQDRPRRLFLPGATDPSGFTQYSNFNLIANYDAKAWSLYSSDEWQLTDQLRIDLGVRYDREKVTGSVSTGETVDLDGNPATPWDNSTALAGPGRNHIDRSFDNVGWSVGFNYEFTTQQAIFGHYTDSAKLPHFDDLRNGVNMKDNIRSAELGYKVSLPSFVLFATLFQTEFDNVPFQDILANGETIVRLAKTRTRGVELEGELRAFGALDVRYNLTVQDPKYENYKGGAFDNTGNQIRRIPKEMGRITPTFSFLGDRAQVFVTYTYVGKRYSNDENSVVLPAYNKFDAGLLFTVGTSWTFQLTGDNLTNEVGLTEGNPRIESAAGVGAIYLARPLFGRSYLGSVTYKF